jgi:hypothetical protein
MTQARMTEAEFIQYAQEHFYARDGRPDEEIQGWVVRAIQCTYDCMHAQIYGNAGFPDAWSPNLKEDTPS